MEKARGTLVKAEKNLGYCTIKSPVKGIIIDRRVNVGQTVRVQFERAEPVPHREGLAAIADLGLGE